MKKLLIIVLILTTSFGFSQDSEWTYLFDGKTLDGWHEYNGWTITKDSDGWWVYAKGNNGRELTPSIFKVGIDQEPEQQSSIKKGIRPEAIVLIDNAPVPDIQNTRTDTFYVPMILVEFPDAYAIYEPSEFDLIMNQAGYTHLNYDNTCLLYTSPSPRDS